MSDDETWTMLRDKSGLMHVPHDDGRPVCGSDRDCDRVEHPVTNAAIWCTDCLRMQSGVV